MIDNKIYEVQKTIDAAYSALLKGDTYLASAKFQEAADFVSFFISKHKDNDRIDLIMAQATLYFQGGEYKLCRKILEGVSCEKEFNQEELEMWKSCNRKTDANYKVNMKFIITNLCNKGLWRDLLSTLADEPYVIDPVQMAKYRKLSCEKLGYDELAKEFDKDIHELEKNGNF